MSASLGDLLDRLLAGAGGDDVHAVALEHARQREDVAHVVVDHQHALVAQRFVGFVQALHHASLGRRQFGDHAMQEQRGLVEQALGRFARP